MPKIITGNGNDNVLVGTSGDDEIWGMQGNDVLKGGGGHDTLNGGPGDDTMYGGIGNDTYIVDSVDDDVYEYENGGTDTIRTSVTYSLNWTPHVEDMVLTGSADIDGYGNALDNDIYGNSGNNTLKGAGGADYLSGGSGHDILVGGVGADTMLGGYGDDFFSVDDAGDVVTEYKNQEIDTVSSSLKNYTLGANVEHLVMTYAGNNSSGIGNELGNTITGTSFNNHIDGGLGADIMKGGDGHDQYVVDNAGDVIFEFDNEGNDLVMSSIHYTLGSNLERLTLMGSANLEGRGNDKDNAITGNSGDNELYGYDGNDGFFSFSSADADTMVGGIGDDYYHFDHANHTLIELAGEGTDWVFAYGDMSYALPDHIENLFLDVQGRRALRHGQRAGQPHRRRHACQRARRRHRRRHHGWLWRRR